MRTARAGLGGLPPRGGGRPQHGQPLGRRRGAVVVVVHASSRRRLTGRRQGRPSVGGRDGSGARQPSGARPAATARQWPRFTHPPTAGARARQGPSTPGSTRAAAASRRHRGTKACQPRRRRSVSKKTRHPSPAGVRAGTRCRANEKPAVPSRPQPAAACRAGRQARLPFQQLPWTAKTGGDAAPTGPTDKENTRRQNVPSQPGKHNEPGRPTNSPCHAQPSS